jgi:hypothetical protein
MSAEGIFYKKRKVARRTLNPRNLRVACFFDVELYNKLSNIAAQTEQSLSNTIYNCLKKFFVINDELKKWKIIAQSQMDVQKELENKLKIEKETHKDEVIRGLEE